MFEALKPPYKVILADPPWRFEVYSRATGLGRSADNHYDTMAFPDILAMPVESLADKDCVLFLWVTAPFLRYSFRVIDAWGFNYKTMAFSWLKANGAQIDMFDDAIPADMKAGYWTRSNGEVCLLATRGEPKRVNADVRMGIIEPARQHSRKPDCVHGRIERLVEGPYLELFARKQRPGWDTWGNETSKFAA